MNVAVRGICVQDGKLFCVKNTDYRTGTPNRFWCTPGGGVDDGEDLHTALRREIKEELGIEVEIGKLLYIQEYFDKHAKNTNLEFFFHIHNDLDFNNIDLSKTTHGKEEIAEFGFIDPSQEFTLPKFLASEPYKDLDSQAVKIFNYL